MPLSFGVIPDKNCACAALIILCGGYDHKPPLQERKQARVSCHVRSATNQLTLCNEIQASVSAAECRARPHPHSDPVVLELIRAGHTKVLLGTNHGENWGQACLSRLPKFP